MTPLVRPNDRVTDIQLPDGAHQLKSYFATGEVQREWGERQYPIDYTYDSQGRMRTMTTWRDAAAGTGAATTTWEYHPARGTLSRKSYQDGKHLDYTYSAGGRLLTRTGGRGIETTYGYDLQTGDLLTVTYSDGTPCATFTYDRAGRQESVADAAGLRRMAYSDGLLQTETYESGLLQGVSLGRTYDLARLASLALSVNGTPVHGATYGYRDTQGRDTGRLASVASGALAVRYAYTPNSNLLHTTTWADGSTDRLQAVNFFDHMNRLQSRATTDAAGRTLRSVGYGYNEANQRVRAELETGEHWTCYEGVAGKDENVVGFLGG